MKIELKNKELRPAINFLSGLVLKTKDSRHRSKLVKIISEALKEYAEEEKKLTEIHGLVDEAGILVKESKRDPLKVAAFNKDQDALTEEVVVIEGGMYAKNIDEIPRILREFEGELSGSDAEIYDRLLDEFEKGNEDAE